MIWREKKSFLVHIKGGQAMSVQVDRTVIQANPFPISWEKKKMSLDISPYLCLKQRAEPHNIMARYVGTHCLDQPAPWRRQIGGVGESHALGLLLLQLQLPVEGW